MKLHEMINNVMETLDEKAPAIKITIGVVGLVTAGVLACKATLKVKEKTEPERKALKDIHKIKAAQERTEKGIPDEVKRGDEVEVLVPKEERVSEDIQKAYTNKDHGKDIIRVIFSYAKKLFALYGIPIALTVGSIFMIARGTIQFNERYLSAMALSASLEKAFSTYRERVKERFGEEVERDIRYGLETQKEKVKVTDEDGKTKTVTQEKKVVTTDPTACSPYAFIFDERFSQWVGDINFDETFARGMEWTLNDRLTHKRRYLVMNDILEAFGAPDDMYKPEFMHAGWLRGSEDGDGRIKLRIQRIFVMQEVDGIMKAVPKILIDPNAEGNVYKKLIAKNGY